MAPNRLFMPKLSLRGLIVSSALGLIPAGQAFAENGAIAYARPASGIVIDGDLSDWPFDAMRFPIETAVWNNDDWRDAAFFRTAYDPSGAYLYLAVEVADESAVNLSEGGPTEEDSLVVYLDPQHSLRGSGPWAFLAGLDGAENISSSQGWDPQTARATEESANMAVVQADGWRVYEWRIQLDQPVRAGMTLGLDLILVDVDADASDNPTGFVAWGEFGNKASRAARLGDLVLLDADAALGTLSGGMAWAQGVDGPDLGGRRVRIINRDDPELWVTAASDDQGDYSVELPAGDYCVIPAFLLYGAEAEYRMTDDSEVCARVEAGVETQAPTLVKSIRTRPEHHIQEAGLLFAFDDEAAARLDAFMADYMDHFTVPGAGVVIVRDGEIVYRQEYGVTNWLTQEPVRPEHLFDVGSITKTVFAFAVHRLVEQGVLELDRPLHEYMPFEDIAHDARSERFTARYVLSHQTGLPNWRWQNDSGELDIAFTPGEGYRYSGEGYDYLGRVIEHLTGEALETVLLREAVEPLDMSAAVRFSKRDDWHAVFVHGHSELRALTSQTPDEAHAAYSMMASASDLAQVLLTWMQRGGGLSESGYEAMFEAQVDAGYTATDTAWPTYHALGPRVIETPYGRAIGHGGVNAGQIALMEFYEDHNAGFVLTTNGDFGWHIRDALRRFLVAGEQHTVLESDQDE